MLKFVYVYGDCSDQPVSAWLAILAAILYVTSSTNVQYLRFSLNYIKVNVIIPHF